MITRMLSSLVRANHRSAGPRPRAREVARPPFRLELLEERCDICGVLPTALDDEYWATAGELLTVLPSGVLANDGLGSQGGPEDTDPCGTTLSAVLDDGPSEGSLSLNSDGSLTFTKEFAGAVTFTYMACDNLGYCSTVATVTIYVQKVPAQVKFDQEINQAGIFGYIGYGPYGQPAGRTTGNLYGSAGTNWQGNPIRGAWETPPAWATSYVSVWTTAAGQDVCNSGPGLSGTGAGKLTATLKGTPNSTYWVDFQIDVAVTATGSNPYAKATVLNTSASPPTELGQPATGASNGFNDSFQYIATAMAVTVPAGGEAEFVSINPTLCGTNAPGAGSASFTATIYVYSIS